MMDVRFLQKEIMNLNKEIASLSKNYLKNFPEIYKNPSKVNNYLKKHSDNIENDIKDKFVELNLDNNFAIYANGGFGRQEMFPNSDIDLSIIEIGRSKNFNDLENFISFMWDQGYKVGHSVRSISDIKNISKKDLKEFTSYLTRRPIISNQIIDKKITKILSRLWSSNDFYNQKLVEQQKRHIQYYSTAYNLEPDLKESPGTMRDFHTALWILQHCYGLDSLNAIDNANVISEGFEKTTQAYNFIKSLRFATNITTL